MPPRHTTTSPRPSAPSAPTGASTRRSRPPHPQTPRQRQAPNAVGSSRRVPQIPWTADPQGRIIGFSQRWLEATGLTHQAALGEGWQQVPHPEDLPVMAAAWTQSVATGDPYDVVIRLRMADGMYRWWRVRAFPRRNAAGQVVRWYGTIEDIHDRIQAEARLAALVELGDRLHSLRDPASIAQTAAEVIGRALGAARVGYGRVDNTEEMVRIERDWTAPEVASVVGEWPLAEFWTNFADAMRRGEAVLVADVVADPRTAAYAAAYIAVGVRASLQVPVVEGGRVTALLFVHEAAPRAWTEEEVAFARGAAERVWAAAERVRAEARQTLMAREVDHRAKNALAVVLAVLRLTPKDDAAVYARAVEGRVAALARAQTLLAEDRWHGADLHALLRGELAPFLVAAADVTDCGPGSGADLNGPSVALPPGAAQPLAMAIHELATNAVKYGALSVPAGRVAVSWCLDRNAAGETLRLRWTGTETDGPPVRHAPVRRGFGSRVLDSTVRSQLGGRVSLAWEPSGLVCEMEVLLRREPALPCGRDHVAAAG
ncbi:PAS domain-containing protein [Paracraurococcus lichenis]|uniref:histidine kinase n=1 Tax=Paracraurococcus lichenis TaxID=3064888 RepID=A0ABT9E971_9PROT|nr:PAS domain-containing protein [Paracraurococcus sp. LOR1-02]MDO9712734.1 PAS domain-containing protein [Paracraurococcus sp. LOR1-02]